MSAVIGNEENAKQTLTDFEKVERNFIKNLYSFFVK